MAQSKKRNKKAHVPLSMFQTLAAMSAQTGIPRSVLDMAQEKGCKFDHHGRYDLKDFNEWFFAQKLTQEEMEDWTRRYKRAQAIEKELKNAQTEKDIVKYDVAGQFLDALVHRIFFGELERIAQEFPPSLKGRAEVEIETEVLRQIETIKKQLTAKLDEWEKLGEKQTEEM